MDRNQSVVEKELAPAGEVIPKSIYLNVVAALIREAIGDGYQVMNYLGVITSLNAEKFSITMEHDPSFAMSITVAELRAIETAHWRWILKNVPDYHQEDTEVWVEGDALCFNETLVGTFPDGKVNRSVVKMKFWFDDDGKINRQHVNYKPEEVAPTQQLIAQMPAGWTGEI